MTLTSILLDSKLKKGGKTDTDQDALTDSQEINWKLVKSPEPLKLYTIGELIGNSKKEYISKSLNRFSPDQRAYIANIGVIPEITKLMKKDMDKDGIPDIEDLRPRNYDIDSILLFVTKKGKETDKDEKKAEDLMINDYSKEQIEKLNDRFKSNTKQSVEKQKNAFMKLVKSLSLNYLQKTGIKMVNKFMEGKGEDFSDPEFTDLFFANGNTKD